MAVVKVNDLHIGYNDARPTGSAGADEEALLFLHGVGSDKSVWDAQLEHFSQTRRAVALDYPGYGESDLPAADLNRAQIACYVFGALAALGLERAHVVGLSMGAVIALEMWRQSSSRLCSMILADAFACYPQAAQIVERSLRAIDEMTMRSFAELRVNSILTPGAPAAIKQKVTDTMARIDKRTYRWSSPAVWTADYRTLLPLVNLPTLVIVGEQDQVTPRALSEELRETIPEASMETVPAAGHLSNVENPRAFNLLIEKHINALEREAHLLAS